MRLRPEAYATSQDRPSNSVTESVAYIQPAYDNVICRKKAGSEFPPPLRHRETALGGGRGRVRFEKGLTVGLLLTTRQYLLGVHGKG
jgi:hypothetical protein